MIASSSEIDHKEALMKLFVDSRAVGYIQHQSGQTACVVCGGLRKPTLSNMQIDLTVMDVPTLVVG